MKICLCGSTRFMDQFHSANVMLSLMGHVVYSVATSTKGDFQPTEDQKTALDAVHFSKIDESDAIMVVGRQDDGTTYIGYSTRREIMYARLRDKAVFFYDPRQEISGPFSQFQSDMALASETDAVREAARIEAEAQRREWEKTFQTDDEGQPVPKAFEEVTN